MFCDSLIGSVGRKKFRGIKVCVRVYIAINIALCTIKFPDAEAKRRECGGDGIHLCWRSSCTAASSSSNIAESSCPFHRRNLTLSSTKTTRQQVKGDGLSTTSHPIVVRRRLNVHQHACEVMVAYKVWALLSRAL